MGGIKFKCENDHLIEVDLPDNYYDDGPLVLKCTKCNTRYEVAKNDGKYYIQPYSHSDPLRFIAMHY